MAHLTGRPGRGALLLATVLLGAALLVAGAATTAPWAGASPKARGAAAGSPCTTAKLPAARILVARALSRRAVRLEVLQARVAGSKALSTADRAALTGDLTAQLLGIKALEAKVPGDTTCAALESDAQAMVVTYRVFTVMSPQVHLAIAADTETAIVARLAGLEPAISARIAAAQAQGVTVAAAQGTFSDFTTQITSATQASSGVSASVLALTPAAFPGSHQTLETAASALARGRGALEQADTDLRTLKEDARAEARRSR